MNSSVGLPSSLTVEKIWWNNILLLGFDVQLNEKKYNTSFSSLMFKKTNVKGMEVMLHFLLFRLDPDRAKERFRSVFPVLEKSQGRDYRRVVLEELERLEKAGKLPPSTLRASLLQTCAGDRFYLMIWMLSVESIKEVIKREVGEKYLTLLPSPAASSNSSAPSLLPISAQARILSSHIALQSRNFLSTSKSMSDAQNSWKNFVNTLQSQINQALTSLSDFLQQEKEFEEDSKQLNLASFEELQQKIGQVRQTWDYLEQLEDDRDKENQCLDNFLNKKSESNLLLDGSSLRYSVPNALFHESILSHSDQSGNSQALQQQPVSLSQLAAMWNRSLIKIDEAFAQFPLDDEKLDQEIKEIDKALELQISHSSSLTSLNQKLEKEISDIQASIKVLQTQIDSSAFPPHLQPTLLSASSESLHSLPSSTHLSLVPPTPNCKYATATTPRRRKSSAAPHLTRTPSRRRASQIPAPSSPAFVSSDQPPSLFRGLDTVSSNELENLAQSLFKQAEVPFLDSTASAHSLRSQSVRPVLMSPDKLTLELAPQQTPSLTLSSSTSPIQNQEIMMQTTPPRSPANIFSPLNSPLRQSGACSLIAPTFSFVGNSGEKSKTPQVPLLSPNFAFQEMERDSLRSQEQLFSVDVQLFVNYSDHTNQREGLGELGEDLAFLQEAHDISFSSRQDDDELGDVEGESFLLSPIVPFALSSMVSDQIVHNMPFSPVEDLEKLFSSIETKPNTRKTDKLQPKTLRF